MLAWWATLLAVALGLTYVIFLVIVAATDPQPARAARLLASENAYGVLIVAACVAARLALRRRDASRPTPTSFLALLSALLAILNPALVGAAFGALGIHGVSGGGDSEMYSFAVGLAALVIGTVAAVRIRRGGGVRTGMTLAVVGIVAGGSWVAFWFALTLAFAAGMAGFR